jgi:hypothetical protein
MIVCVYVPTTFNSLRLITFCPSENQFRWLLQLADEVHAWVMHQEEGKVAQKVRPCPCLDLYGVEDNWIAMNLAAISNAIWTRM